MDRSTKRDFASKMKPKTKLYIANSAMVTGLLPYLAVFGYVALTSDERGDAAMGVAFHILLGLGFAYIAALLVAFPASLWSRSLARSFKLDPRSSVLLRRAVACGVFPLFAIFPLLAIAILRS
jgi:hypothetical protein